MNIHAKRRELNVNELNRTGPVFRQGPQSVNNWMKTAQFIHVRSAVHEYLREGLTLIHRVGLSAARRTDGSVGIGSTDESVAMVSDSSVS